MAKNNKEKKDTKDFPEFDTSKIEESLSKMVDDMLKLATEVVDDYKNLDVSELSNLSGSVTQINENSPFLNEIFEGDSWKKVMTMANAFNQQSGSKINDTE
jgi:hypothetical protein